MEAIKSIAARIKCLICDLDGVLTDGLLYFGPEGELMKSFSVQDGLGLKLLMQSGLEVAVITASTTPIVTERLKTLGIKHIYLGQINKVKAYEELLSKLNLSENDVAYVGDDWPDLPLIKRSALGITVANGIAQLKAEADWTTSARGGNGAIREISDLILESQDSLNQVLEHYGV